jgi:hypothetical protein
VDAVASHQAVRALPSPSGQAIPKFTGYAGSGVTLSRLALAQVQLESASGGAKPTHRGGNGIRLESRRNLAQSERTG